MISIERYYSHGTLMIDLSFAKSNLFSRLIRDFKFPHIK